MRQVFGHSSAKCSNHQDGKTTGNGIRHDTNDASKSSILYENSTSSSVYQGQKQTADKHRWAIKNVGPAAAAVLLRGWIVEGLSALLLLLLLLMLQLVKQDDLSAAARMLHRKLPVR